MIRDVRLLASGRRAAFVVQDGEVVAVHLPSNRVSVEELEELASLARDGDFEKEEAT